MIITRLEQLAELQEAFQNDDALLNAIVRALSDDDFNVIYNFIVKMYGLDYQEEE